MYPLKVVLIVAILIWSLVMTGCPKGQKTVRTMKEKSAEMSIYGAKLVTAFGDAYRAREITQGQLAQLNVATKAFTIGLGAYRTAIAELERQVEANPTLPAGALDRLQVIFNDQVVATFFQILAAVGVVSLDKSQIIQTIISSIRLTILAIQGAFSEVRYNLKLPQPNAA